MVTRAPTCKTSLFQLSEWSGPEELNGQQRINSLTEGQNCLVSNFDAQCSFKTARFRKNWLIIKVLKICVPSKTIIKIYKVAISETGGNKQKLWLSLFLQTQKNRDGPPFNLFCIPCSFRFVNSGMLSGNTIFCTSEYCINHYSQIIIKISQCCAIVHNQLHLIFFTLMLPHIRFHSPLELIQILSFF